MIKKLLILFIAFVCNATYGQLVINELDADTPSTDVKEFIEIKSAIPNFALDGYVVVFFNGSTSGLSNLSYYAIDLDGLVTDGNGNVLLGNLQVSPSPSYIIPQSTIQNGPDAVAIYLGDATDFPTNTPGTTTNLIDALVYSNSGSTSATTLMTALNETVSYNENMNSAAATQSIQRKSDGTYEVKAPTPRANNDGSGIVYNGISTTYTPSAPLSEGQNITLTFTTDTNVTSDLNLSITLNNGTFTNADYSGTLNVTIPTGSNNVSTVIQILDDAVNDGDETLQISIGTVPSNYIILNNNIPLRVNDINFNVAPFGTPLNPTYGIVSSTAPAGYYASLEGLSGAALKQAVQDIIADPSVVHLHSYADIWEILRTADQNPLNSNQVWCMYIEQPMSKIDQQTGSSIVGKWNREHIFCQSRGGFTPAPGDTADGIGVWNSTNASNTVDGVSDAHHIRAENGQENSSRNNKNYGPVGTATVYAGPAGTQGSWHGDVARSLFYMAVRFNALNVVNGDPSEYMPDGVTPSGNIGDLATLLTWNNTDPRDDYEMNRNNYIYTWQVNRNPFIDYPNLADYIFGSNYGQPWSATLSTTDFNDLKVQLYPNPASDRITIAGVAGEGIVEIYSLTGQKVKSIAFNGQTNLNLDLQSGLYMVKITSDNKSTTRRLIVK